MPIPILKIRNILLSSIQMDLEDDEALQFQEDLIGRTRSTRCAGVIIDITALDVVDSFMARVLNDTANMVRLVGAHAVVCGMQPAVALTLVEMGRELIGVKVALNLDQAMDELESRIARGERALK